MKTATKTILALTTTAVLAAAGALRLLNTHESRPLDLSPAERLWLSERTEPIRVAPLPDSPPLDFIDDAGQHQGLTADYLQLIEEHLGLQFEMVPCENWKQIVEKLENREIDVVGSIQNTMERRKFLRFTEPYLRIRNVIITRKGWRGSYTLDNMGGLEIAIVDGSATYDYVRKMHPEYNIVPVDNAVAGFRMVSLVQADAMVADFGVASHYIDALGIVNLRIAGDIEYPWELCFASRKDWPMLNSILNKALANISSAQRKAIKREWITLDNAIPVSRELYFQIIGGILLFTLLAIGSVMFWNRTLRKQVTHRTHELGRVRERHEQAAQALGESEERFRVLVESSSDMIWETDQYGNYTYVSPRVHSILGYEPEQLLGQSSLSLMVPVDAAKNLQTLREATANTIIDCDTHTYNHKDGRKVMLESSGMAFADNTGILAGFRGVSRDITDRVTSEAALKASEERFRNLVETTSDWIWEVDRDGRFIYASPQVVDILGYSPKELIGKRLMDLMPEKEADLAETIYREAVQQGAAIDSKVNHNLHKDGRVVVLETSAVPFYDEDWNITGYRGIGRDITDRTAAEKQLEFERSLFHSFMEHAPDLIYFKNDAGRFIEVNAAKANEVRLPPEELIGKSDFDFYPREQAQQMYDEEQEIMRSERALQKEEFATTPDGDRWYLTTKVPRYDEQGKVVGTFGTSWNITHRKIAEEELRQLRAMLSNIIDSMPSILVGVDLNGRVTQWNRKAEHATRTMQQDAVGKPLNEAFPRLAKEMVKVERAIRERTSQKEERIPVHEDGRRRYNDITVYPLLDNDTEGAVIRIDDVTDRVLIEDSIRNIVEGVSSVGRRFFASMVNQLAKVLDADFTYISEFSDDTRSTMRTISASNRGIIADNFDYVLKGTPCEEVLQGDKWLFRESVQGQLPKTARLQSLGIEHYIGIPLVDSEGHPLGVMAAMYRKPVEQLEFATSVMQVFAGRTAAELERLQATKELLTLRNLLSNIINSMPSILVGVDMEGRVMQWNREAERVTGIHADRAHGQKLDAVFPNVGKEMEQLLSAIESRGTHQHDERVPCTIGGENRVIDITVYPITADGAEGAVIRMDDVTDRVRIEEMMVQSEKMMSVGGLAAGMAHEINNPLAGILQNLQVMHNRFTQATKRNTSAAEAAGTSLEAIQAFMQERGLLAMMDTVIEAGRRASKIVDNMLSFSRKDEAHYEQNNLEEILERSVELASNDYNLKKRFDFRHLRIDREYDPALEPIPCESNQIQQVIMNLLSNSAQAMAEETPSAKEPRITLRLRKGAKAAVIEVEDNGPGMDAETRKRAFEPFFTTKEVGHGTGLGLSVSYFIVTENHGGTMRVDSAPGKGARFIIRLPSVHQQTRWGLRL
ncbi:PAS domain S-box protein [Pontiella sulfatireligans]|uniref:histidine kinase n=1 Tax=Pontiella sulfatireligans TaxID=2750658 RepID=A0A6C2UMD2_9BACT|nr:PAS domain S-box protein [Pontiella sulfatireligans]VGO21288.1 Sensor kinase CckA [Pontiella sulfatireligans]